MQLTAARLVEVRSALNALKERRLPNLDSDLLVAGLYSGLKPTLKEYDGIIKGLQRELKAAETDEEKEALEDRFEELHDREFTVPAPKKKLTKANLPKSFGGERGEANSTANAGIIIALGEEYFDLEDAPVEAAPEE